MNKKYLYLFAALALPALFFAFLKMFGKNEFDIPIYFKEGISPDSICNVSADGVYTITDSVFNRLELNKESEAKVIIIYPFVKEDLSEVERVVSKYSSKLLDKVVISGVINNPITNIRRVFLDYNEFGPTVYCDLRVEEPWSVVLIDKKNHIRGFYDGSRRDEMDRLDTELSILLKMY